MSTYGKIIDAWREGDTIFYRANVFGNDSKALRIIREGLAKSVSIAVEFSKTVCSSCGKLARDNQEPNLLQHLCENAHELVIDPKPYEVSLVSFPAYKESSISVAGKKQRSLVNLLDRLDTVTNDLLRKRREADGKGKPETLPDSPEDDQDDAPVTRKGKSGSSLLDKTNWKRPREEKPVTVGPTPSMINMHSFREAESAYRAKEILESVDIFGKERILLVDPLMAELRKVKARKQ
ncbi:MAG: hypothetical protein HYU39_02265 [Thaumarchaeota archaeon]|nr:hypothetical protein [Nitrososphaerota archaeon]